MIRILILLAVVLVIIGGLALSQDLRAKTNDGRSVILKDDGTWQFLKKNQSSLATRKASSSNPRRRTTEITAKGGNFGLRYDPSVWIPQENPHPGRTVFQHKDGDVYGVLIVDRVSVTTESMKQIAIVNARTIAPDIEVTSEEYHYLNGMKVLSLKMEGTFQGMTFIYYGYYYGSESGGVQCVTYCGRNLFKEYEPQMTEFLEGLVIKQEERGGLE